MIGLREFEENKLIFYPKGKKWIRYCKICRGIQPGSCVICKMTATVMRATFPQLVEHSQYIRDTWEKLRKFNMSSSGQPDVDAECLRMFGSWLPRPILPELPPPKKKSRRQLKREAAAVSSARPKG